MILLPGMKPALREMEQARQQLAPRQVTGGAEQNHDLGISRADSGRTSGQCPAPRTATIVASCPARRRSFWCAGGNAQRNFAAAHNMTKHRVTAASGLGGSAPLTSHAPAPSRVAGMVGGKAQASVDRGSSPPPQYAAQRQRRAGKARYAPAHCRRCVPHGRSLTSARHQGSGWPNFGSNGWRSGSQTVPSRGGVVDIR